MKNDEKWTKLYPGNIMDLEQKLTVIIFLIYMVLF